MTICIVLAGSLGAMAVWFAVKLLRMFRRFRVHKMYTAAIEAPSVSVCIPARNETHAMTQCLERVLASDYKKLEVIVFDDSSVDNTSILIRSFAHAGVRFVPGEKLPLGWLGKNHALDILAREASGTYIIFLDVDTAIEPTTISQLVGYAMTEKVEMVSVVPMRSDTWRASMLFGSLRYFWQLILSRRDALAASSALWLIRRETLLTTLGGLSSYKNDVQPETSIAARLGVSHYHCLVSTESLGVNYEKRWSSQVQTARRLLYPMAGGNALGGLLALVVLLLLNLPFFALLSGFIFGWAEPQIVAFWLTIIYMAVYGIFTSHKWRHNWWMGALLWPLVIMQELLLFVGSWLGYARHTITWKGRPITAAKRDNTVN